MQQRIKSYVLRAGRISPRQQHGLEHGLKAYELPQDGKPWCLEAIFKRQADTVLEIGFGMGASLLAMAARYPEQNFIGIEVHRAGIGRLAADIEEQGLTNLRIAPFDAVDVITTYLADECLSGVQIFFPDPWPKARHHKRRLIQPAFIAHLVTKLKKGGFIHCATDWEAYAEHMLAVLSAESAIQNTQVGGGYAPRPDTRPITKFEARGHRLGHGIWDVLFTRI